jgi:hypothetical protein
MGLFRVILRGVPNILIDGFFFLSDYISRELVKFERVDSKKSNCWYRYSTKTLVSFSVTSVYFIWWNYIFIFNMTVKVISLLSSEANLYLLLIEIVINRTTGGTCNWERFAVYAYDICLKVEVTFLLLWSADLFILIFIRLSQGYPQRYWGGG